MALRLGMVAVIVGLGYALFLEITSAPGNCVNRSISAYYYTPARSVFVGALLALGLAMIALWGRTAFEDLCLNLAGMLAPVVAFVPTLDANYCSLVTTTGGVPKPAGQTPEETEVARKALIAANSEAVSNNFSTLLVVLVIALVFTGVMLARFALRQGFTKEVEWYTITWVAAALLWLIGVIRFNTEPDWFDREAHWVSALTMFGLVILAVLAAGFDKKSPEERWWRATYWALGLGMVVSAVFILVTGDLVWEDTWWGVHKVFLAEAAVILLLAVFWAVQTFDVAVKEPPPISEPTNSKGPNWGPWRRH